MRKTVRREVSLRNQGGCAVKQLTDAISVLWISMTDAYHDLEMSVMSGLLPDSRIIGGLTAAKGQFPWHVAVFGQSSNTFKCSGSIIDNQWILTTASCIHNAGNVTILAGSTTLDGNDPETVKIPSEKLIVHEKFVSAESMKNNIGLIKLARTLPLSNSINVINVPSEPLKDGVSVTVTGFGALNDYSPLSNNLKYVSLQTISNNECSAIFKGTIPDTDVCAGSYSMQAKGICRGDEGSGLVLQASSQKPLLVGIANYLSKHGCQSGKPSGFTRVASYQDWILRTKNNSSSKLNFSVLSSTLFIVGYFVNNKLFF